jgi:hypothetical protein
VIGTQRLRLFILLIGLLVVAGGVWAYEQGRNLSPSTAATALRSQLHTRYGFRCRPAHNDGTIALAGVDYLCEPLGHPKESGYWISTSAHHITGLQPTG